MLDASSKTTCVVMTHPADTYGSIPRTAIKDELLRFHLNESKLERKSASDTFYGSNFRYIIFILLMFCVTMSCYSIATLYVAAIGMISSDVLHSELTQLRTKHEAGLSWLHVTPPRILQSDGTCPISIHPKNLNNEPVPSTNTTNNILMLNLDAAILESQTQALVEDIQLRVAQGQLVDWTIEQRGLIFSAVGIGMMLSALPQSRLGLHFGSKKVAAVGVLSCAIHTLLMPVVAANSPFWLTLTFEFVCGCFVYSMLSVFLPLAAAWFLPHEASALVALAQVCSLVGAALNDLISTQLLSYKVHWSWLFYLPGILNALLWLAWMFLGADRPDQCRYVTREELKILENSVANNKAQAADDIQANYLIQTGLDSCLCDRNEALKCPANKVRRVPMWTKLATCPVVLTMICVNFGAQWNLAVTNLMPTFYTNILHWSPSTIGLVISLKGLFGLIYGTSFAYATRKLSTDRPFKMTLTAFRRTAQILSTFSDVVRAMILVMFDCSLVANSLSQLLVIVTSNFDVLSYHQMPLDLSPEDSGLLITWMRLFTVSDALATPVSGWIISASTDSPELPNGDRHAWRLVWLLGALIKMAGCICFVRFAKAEPRSYSRLVPTGPCKTRLSLPKEDMPGDCVDINAKQAGEETKILMVVQSAVTRL